MPGAFGRRRVFGGPVAKRALLEGLRRPIYDRISVATAATENGFFGLALNAALAAAVNGATKTLSDTNLNSAGQLNTPDSHDTYGVALKYESDISRADLNAFINRSHLEWRVGEKFYIQVPVNCVPAGEGLYAHCCLDGATVSTEIFHGQLGAPMAKNIYDVTIPEEVFSEADGEYIPTGGVVPVHIPSQQAFTARVVHPGAITLAATRAVYLFLWGISRRATM